MDITIKDISDKTGWPKRKIQRFIAEHIELGIVMEERKKTVLTQLQATQLCALIAQECADSDAEVPESVSNSATLIESTATRAQERADFSVKTALVAEQSFSLELLESLHEQINELTERAAKAEGRAEELERQVQDLKDQRQSVDDERKELQAKLSATTGLLESAEAKAERAQAEADSFEKSWFGLYRKKSV